MNQQHKPKAHPGGNQGGPIQTARGAAIHSKLAYPLPLHCTIFESDTQPSREPGTPDRPKAGEIPQANHTGALCAPLLRERQELLTKYYQASTAGLLWESRRIAARYRRVIKLLHSIGGLPECQPN